MGEQFVLGNLEILQKHSDKKATVKYMKVDYTMLLRYTVPSFYLDKFNFFKCFHERFKWYKNFGGTWDLKKKHSDWLLKFT